MGTRHHVTDDVEAPFVLGREANSTPSLVLFGSVRAPFLKGTEGNPDDAFLDCSLEATLPVSAFCSVRLYLLHGRDPGALPSRESHFRLSSEIKPLAWILGR